MDDKSNIDPNSDEIQRIRFAAESAAFYVHVARRAIGTYAAIYNHAGYSGNHDETNKERLDVVALHLQSHYDKCTQLLQHVSQVFESVSLAYCTCHKVIDFHMRAAGDQLPNPEEFDNSKIEDIKTNLTKLSGYVDWHRNGRSSLPGDLKEFETLALIDDSDKLVSVNSVKGKIKELTVSGAMILIACDERQKNTIRRWLNSNVLKTQSGRGGHRYCATSFFEKINEPSTGDQELETESTIGDTSVKTKSQKSSFRIRSNIRKSDYEKSGNFFFSKSSK